MAIKKLQNNFTTPEQSKRLLELGVPADSADQLYYEDCMWSAHEFLSPKHLYSEVVKGHENIAIPCWSVGRLMEIFLLCSPYSSIEINKSDKVEQMIASIELEHKLLDFSKLEEPEV